MILPLKNKAYLRVAANNCFRHLSKRNLPRSSHHRSISSLVALSKVQDSSDTNNGGIHGIQTISAVAAVLLAGGSTLFTENSNNDTTKCYHPSPTPASIGVDDKFEDKATSIDDMPIYTSADVAKNDGKNGSSIWVSYGGVVYDVTEFIYNHPGGSERILQAAGSAVEPFWHLYRQHFASDLPMRLMEDLIIGRLDEKSQDAIDDQMEKMMDENEDPFAHEPSRSESLIVHSDQPMNAEVPAELLTKSYVTPVELFYIRHHHPVPLLMTEEIKNFQVEIDLSPFADSLKNKSSPITKVSLDEIKKLPKVEVTTTLQCSGNRRGDMNGVKRTSGTAWSQGAISTATWGGARLVDVLKLAGLDDPFALTEKDGLQKYVRFESIDGMKASIHMEKATNPYGDVIIAYEMNGKDIPREHGFPLRAIVPGYSAVRNVKWVNKIEVSPQESEGAWQRGLNYKTLPPNVTNAKTIDLKAMPSMTEVSIFSGITQIDKVEEKATVKAGEKTTVKAKGWAWAGSGRNIVRVDITGDGGKSWATADIVKGGDQKFGRAWAWVFWECEVPAVVDKDGNVSLASKAVDMAFNSQPENAAHGWNVRGLGNNSWYRVKSKLS